MKHYNFSVPLYSKEQIYVAMQTKEIVAALVASAFQIDVDIAKTEIVSHSKWGWRERILLNLAIKTKNGLAMADAAVFVCDILKHVLVAAHTLFMCRKKSSISGMVTFWLISRVNCMG